MAASFATVGPVGTLTFPAGTSDGVEISGRNVGSLALRGTTTQASIASGSASGTAGAGTSSTSLAKPTAASNWTAANLVGKFLLITGGGGYDAARLTLRPIKANTTTTLTVGAIVGMDSTTTFQIVTLSGLVDRISSGDQQAIRVRSCAAPIVIEGLAFSGAHALDGLLDVSDCADVLITGCKFDQNTVQSATLVQRCGRVRFEHNLLTSSSDVEISRCQVVDALGVVNSGGGVLWVHDSAHVTAGVEASSSPSQVLRLERLQDAAIEGSSISAGATPFYVEDVASLEVTGGGLSGTGNTGYGIEVAGSGKVDLTGATVTGGSGDVLYLGNAVSWATLSGTDYGAVESYQGSATARVSVVKGIRYGNVLFDGSVDVSGRLLEYGYHNFSQASGLTAAGTTASDALQLGAVAYARVDTVASGTGVRLPLGAALPGVPCVVHNNGANTLNVYHPPSGSLNGGTSAFTIAAGSRHLFFSSSNDGLGWVSVAGT